ncbi:hypothetical protein LCGC14_1728110 [marine sediment metagenome]|uniref:Uncharacterized protein n=1 Tax=marine sediment metagenome TaxID=412755 RepID=A0A0F9HA85_9ZZZZ
MKRVLWSIGVFLLLSASAGATDFERVLIDGKAATRIQSMSSDTQSISVVRTDTDEQVLCLPATGSQIVEGDTTVISRISQDVILVSFAWSELNCAGIKSLVGPNRYTITFVAPGTAILTEVLTTP